MTARPDFIRSPAFQFYVKEWRSSRSIARMSFAVRGMYLEMLLEQWDAGFVPDSADTCAELLGGRPSAWRSNWNVLRKKFELSGTGKLQNTRLENERVKQRAWRKRAQKGGVATAKKKTSAAKTTSKRPVSAASDAHCVSDRVCVSDSVSEGGKKIPGPEDLRMLWNDGTTSPIPQCQKLSETRTRQATARLKDRPFVEWRNVISKIDSSDFLRGTNDRGWVATFDWMLQPDSAARVLEGKYDNRASNIRAVPRPEPSYDFSWEDECAELHGKDEYGRPMCGSSTFHAAKMAEAS